MARSITGLRRKRGYPLHGNHPREHRQRKANRFVTGLDTSLVIRLLIGEPVDQAKRARLFLDELFKAGERASVSDLVLSEVYFALQYHYQVPKAEILETLRLLLQSNEIIAGGVALEVLKTKNLATANP